MMVHLHQRLAHLLCRGRRARGRKSYIGMLWPWETRLPTWSLVMEEMVTMTTLQEEKAKRKRKILIGIWSRVFQVCYCSFCLDLCNPLQSFPWFLTLSSTGKHSLKKDDSLTKAILEPPKQRTRIAHFDLRTLDEAFTVSLEGLKGVRSLLFTYHKS